MGKREDIRSKVLASIVAHPTALAERTSDNRVRAHIADVGEQVKEGLAARVEKLEAERLSGMVLLRLDPKAIARTGFANRHEFALLPEDAKFRALKDSIQKHGQDTPVRVRTAPAGAKQPYELVEGHRRHAVCLALDAETDAGFSILARIDAAASDARDLVLKMYRENAEREDLSPYEYGRMFQSWLDAEVFPRQGDLAKAVGLSDGSVTQYLQIAELPAEVLLAFSDPRRIAVRWMQELGRALKADREGVVDLARKLVERKPRPAAEAVFRELANVGVDAGKRPASTREEAVKIKGKVAFRLSRRDGRITVKFGKGLDRSLQQELAEGIKDLTEQLLTRRTKGK
jgi:ParB family transcriptional regulator, chromosome partitioning protein